MEPAVAWIDSISTMVPGCTLTAHVPAALATLSGSTPPPVVHVRVDAYGLPSA